MGHETNLPLLPPTLPEGGKEKPFLFLLGADDAEMREIEKVLIKQQQNYRYATGGKSRVHPGNAYQADPITVDNSYTLVCVECEPREFSGWGKLRIIDHHRKGDPGFALPPVHYWEASSLGQVYALLKLPSPDIRARVIAARDHCRFQAAKGGCPGVTKKEVEEIGREVMAEELGISKKDLEWSIKKWKRVIKNSAKIKIGGQLIADLTRLSIEKIYSVDHLSVYEACAELSCAAMILTRNNKSLPNKTVLLGHLKGKTIRHFMEVWAKSHGLIDIYGCDVRGYAGGYHPLASVASVA